MLAWKRRLILFSYRVGDLLSILFSVMICFSFINTEEVLFLNINSRMELLGFIVLSAFVIIELSVFLGVYDILLDEDDDIDYEKWIRSFAVSVISYFIINIMIHFLGVKSSYLDLMIFFMVFVVFSIIIRELNSFIFRLGRYRLEGLNNVLILGRSKRGARYINTIMKNPHSYVNIVGYMQISDENPNEHRLAISHTIPAKEKFDFKLIDKVSNSNEAVIEKETEFNYGFSKAKKIVDVDFEYNRIKYMGHMSALSNILTEITIDEIVVAESLAGKKWLDSFLEDIQEMGITITMLLKKKNKNSAKTQVAMFGDLPALKFHTVSLDQSQLMIKRFMDVLGAIIGMIFFGIAYIVFGPIIKLESPGPIIFKQPRVGKNGRVFYIWKFRSMCDDAEKQKEKLMSQNEMQGHMFKMSNDPRVTKIGNFMRKTSIDELPQFYNVLVGDMSLVGTRPPTLKEVENYQMHQRKRISITPGITGIWQISGRSEITDFEEVVRMDSEYIENWSVILDIKILLKTVVVVLKKRGSK